MCRYIKAHVYRSGIRRLHKSVMFYNLSLCPAARVKHLLAIFFYLKCLVASEECKWLAKPKVSLTQTNKIPLLATALLLYRPNYCEPEETKEMKTGGKRQME